MSDNIKSDPDSRWSEVHERVQGKAQEGAPQAELDALMDKYIPGYEPEKKTTEGR